MAHDYDLTLAAFEPMVTAAAGQPHALLKLAEIAARRTDAKRAMELAEEARRLAPDDPEVGVIASDIIARTVPNFHMSMMHDHPRNEAFAAALARHVRPGMRVLDVGTGAGLLSMMAARAGAGEVWTCEQLAPMAAVARDVIAANGFADRITVLSSHSQDIDAERDMGGRADLVVAEVIGSDIVVEEVIPTMRDVVRRLAQPDARLIPQMAEVRVALAWFDGLDARYVGSIDGFDLSPFNRLVRPEFHVRCDSPTLSLRGPSATLFRFDFGDEDHGPGRREIEIESDGQPYNGIVQWIFLQLDEETVYENMPGTGRPSSWEVHFHPLRDTPALAPGERMRIGGTWRGNRLRLWPASAATDP